MYKDYRSFDSQSERSLAKANAEEYLSRLKGSKTVIDESQLVPEIFPALKERVRKSKSPGQFLLSGSVRFTSRKAVRESLTGRIQYLELLPFSISELEGEPLPSAVRTLIEAKSMEQIPDLFAAARFREKSALFEKYLRRGGLPGVCFIREDKIRKNHIIDQLRTILDRDIRQVYPTTLSFQQIHDYAAALARLEGRPVHLQELRRATEINPITQRKLLYALEAVFLIRRIPIEGGRKGFIAVFEDQGEAFALGAGAHPRAHQLTSLLYRNIRCEFFYDLAKDARFFQYRTLGGVIVPLALAYEDRMLGFVPISGETPNRAEILGAQSFLKTYAASKIVFFHEGKATAAISDRMISIPISRLI